MAGRWPDPEDPVIRDAHLNECIGCKLINGTRGPEEKWILCFEYADRAGHAVRELVGLYDLTHNDMKDKPNHGLPAAANGVVNLRALIEDVCSRFERGSLVTGEARARG